MLTLLLLLQLSQVPCTPGEGSLVCYCKQGVASACETLQATDPKLFAQVEETLRQAALRQAGLLLTGTEVAQQPLQEQEAGQQQATDGAAREQTKEKAPSESQAQATSDAPEPPECKGQSHHIISKPIAKALDRHKTISGLFKPRDPRFVAKAKDEAAHCGYQDWHRKVDEEVIEWLESNEQATLEQFLWKLREIYSRPEMQARFPNGF